MPSDLDTARTRLDLYLQREASILAAGQETFIAGRKRRDAELAEVRAAISQLQAEIQTLEAAASGGSRLYQAVPR